MSIRYLRDKKRFRFEFEATINGQRLRATKLLPAAWDKAKAEAFDRKESDRLYSEATGIQRPVDFIEKAVSLYIDERCPHLKNGVAAAKELSRFFYAYQGRSIEELPEVAREYVQEKANELAPATIRNRLAYLRAACRYAHKFHGMGEHDPAERMQMPQVRNERHHYATRRQMLTIARKMTSHAARVCLRIAFYSGMRISEILAAEVVGNAFLLTDTKNGDRRIVPAHPKLRTCMKHLPLPVKKRWIQRQFSEATKALGMAHLHFHDIRHSAASEMINSGVDLYQVGAVLGHRSSQSTKRYAHLATDTLADAIGLIGKKSRTR